MKIFNFQNLAVVTLSLGCGSQPRQSSAPVTPQPEHQVAEPVETQVSPSSENSAATEQPPIECNKEMLGAVNLSAEDAARRFGLGVTRLSAVTTSLKEPIEVCGPPGQRAWLTLAKCDDGSTADFSRDGSVGSGGRCAGIIDRYLAKCPETEYEVFMDMYMCGPDEEL